MKPSIFCTFFLPVKGDTNPLANLEGENESRNLEAVNTFGDFLLKFAALVGDFLLKFAASVGNRETTGELLIFTWNLEVDSEDFKKNLCGVVCLFLGITGDVVL